MSLISILQDEQISIMADIQNKNIQFEVSSSGYRTKYITVHLNKKEEIDRIIEALTKAKEYLD
jgi:selenocysteine lyase/cysteine desulfurase